MNQWLEWHLHPDAGPKRILALDGGGARGLITLGILQHIEDVLKVRCANPGEFRLHHYFDLIAGTSTGSIIATALALGWKVSEIRSLYDEICPIAFKSRGFGFWRPVYDHGPVEDKLKKVLKTEQLQSPKLNTGLMICSKRFDSGSPWVLTNHPDSKYWNGDENGRHMPNKEFELWTLVRASAAAPLYFQPIEVTLTEQGQVYDEQKGLFIDGAVGGFNNPSLQAMLVATLPSYGFKWKSGRDSLFIVSVGTGWWRMRRESSFWKRCFNWWHATDALAAMIQDTVLHTIVAMQAMSTPRKPWFINSEIEDMRGQRSTAEDVLSFQRYDAMLEGKDVARVFNLGEPGTKNVKKVVDALRRIGNVERQNLFRLYELGINAGRGTQAGKDGVEPEDFPAHFDPPFMRAGAGA